MAKKHEASCEGGAPEYMVSYADMLTIMLAFFIVLYATTGATTAGNKGEKPGQGEQKQAAKSAAKKGKEDPNGKEGAAEEAQKERMDQVFVSLYKRLGPTYDPFNYWLTPVPTATKARSSAPGETGKSVRTQIGTDNVRARGPRSGETRLVGGRIYFKDEASAVLAPSEIEKLKRAVDELAGKMQRIEIRGHASRKPLPGDSPFRNHFDLAYARCTAVADYLTSQKIDPRRFRLSVAGDNEPLDADGEVLSTGQNSRVEIHLLNEFIHTPSGLQERPVPQTAGTN